MPIPFPVYQQEKKAVTNKSPSINSKAAFFILKEAAANVTDGGKIITIVTALLGAFTGFYTSYAGSKAPVEHFTRYIPSPYHSTLSNTLTTPTAESAKNSKPAVLASTTSLQAQWIPVSIHIISRRYQQKLIYILNSILLPARIPRSR